MTTWADPHTTSPRKGFLAVAAAVLVLLGGGCASAADRDQAKAAHDVAAWPLRGNLTGDRALLDDAKERLEVEGREPGSLLIATRVEGLTLLVVETRADDGSFVALYGPSGTPVRVMRLVELGRPTQPWSLSLGIDNDIADMALVVPAPTVARVAIKVGVGPDGQPVFAEVPIRDGVAALRLNGQRPANTLIDLEVEGQVVGSAPELQAMDVDDPVKAEPNFKPGLGDDAAAQSEGYRRDNVALGSFIGLVALGIVAWVAARRLRRRLRVETSSSAGGRRWRRMVLAAVVLAVATPLVFWASSDAMYALAYSDPTFDASGLLLQFVPALLFGAAAVRCARVGLREARSQNSGRAVALSATVAAYLVVGLIVAAVLYLLAALGAGG